MRREFDELHKDQSNLAKKLSDVQRERQKTNVTVTSYEEFNKEMEAKNQKIMNDKKNFEKEVSKI